MRGECDQIAAKCYPICRTQGLVLQIVHILGDRTMYYIEQRPRESSGEWYVETIAGGFESRFFAGEVMYALDTTNTDYRITWYDDDRCRHFDSCNC